ncbi:hypothetical protein I7I50_01226 [Histoplasma capsulatum G186AR]|uniref:Uncharacterized protein n=1 Tax=Ajellomyces capsulatus TaxID=5037 RepID=A0A8H7Z0A6_AJECA|nr:hypothetical protein I7I52_08947 [Histoplasma capsulatum]QSS73164.1 hypothetical protein I7I50_01226 [Histoplasma capsulatum G186AR]
MDELNKALLQEGKGMLCVRTRRETPDGVRLIATMIFSANLPYSATYQPALGSENVSGMPPNTPSGRGEPGR